MLQEMAAKGYTNIHAPFKPVAKAPAIEAEGWPRSVSTYCKMQADSFLTLHCSAVIVSCDL